MQVEGQTDAELVFLLAHDSDPFCRWEAGQTLLRALLTTLYHAARDQKVGATAAPSPSSPHLAMTQSAGLATDLNTCSPTHALLLTALHLSAAICGMCDVTKPGASQQAVGRPCSSQALRVVLCS